MMSDHSLSSNSLYFFAGKCKATQNKIMSCYIISLFYYKRGGDCLILQTVALFTFLLYVTFLLRKSTHTHNFLHLFGNILEPFQGPWKGSQARLLMSKYSWQCQNWEVWIILHIHLHQLIVVAIHIHRCVKRNQRDFRVEDKLVPLSGDVGMVVVTTAPVNPRWPCIMSFDSFAEE